MIPRRARRSSILLPVASRILLILLFRILLLSLVLRMLLPLMLLFSAPSALLPTPLMSPNNRRRQALPGLDLVAKALPTGLWTAGPGTAACSRRVVHAGVGCIAIALVRVGALVDNAAVAVGAFQVGTFTRAALEAEILRA